MNCVCGIGKDVIDGGRINSSCTFPIQIDITGSDPRKTGSVIRGQANIQCSTTTNGSGIAVGHYWGWNNSYINRLSISSAASRGGSRSDRIGDNLIGIRCIV